MRRILLTVLSALLVTVLPVQAQHQGHVVSTPDALKWVDPPTLSRSAASHTILKMNSLG